MAKGISPQGQEGRDYQRDQAEMLRDSDITRSLNEAYRKRFGGQPQQDPRNAQRQEMEQQRPMPEQQMPPQRPMPGQPMPGGGMIDPSIIAGELDQSNGGTNPEWEREYYLKILGMLGLAGRSGAPGPVGPNGYAAPGNGMNTFRFGQQSDGINSQPMQEHYMDQRMEQITPPSNDFYDDDDGVERENENGIRVGPNGRPLRPRTGRGAGNEHLLPFLPQFHSEMGMLPGGAGQFMMQTPFKFL